MKLLVITIVCLIVLGGMTGCCTPGMNTNAVTSDAVYSNSENVQESSTKIERGCNKNYMYNELKEVFENNREKFENVVSLMNNYNGGYIYIEFNAERQILYRAFVDNNEVQVGDLFDELEGQIVLDCFNSMSKISDIGYNIAIVKKTPEDNLSIKSDSVDFWYRTKIEDEYIDYGITWCENIANSNYKKLDDNWYCFEFRLV